MTTSEHYEQLLAFISTHMPAPFTQDEAEGVVVFTGGSPAEVIVRLTATEVIVEEYRPRQETPSRRALRPRRVGMLKWRRLRESALMTLVGELIKAARDARRSRYRVCASCGRTTPPEWMDAKNLCHRCSQHGAPVVH